MMLWIVSMVMGLIALWVIVKLVREVRSASAQYVNIVDYLVERGAKRVVIVLPKWVGYGMLRLYASDGTFIEELVVGKEVQWFIGAIVSKLRREGFDVEVKSA